MKELQQKPATCVVRSSDNFCFLVNQGFIQKLNGNFLAKLIQALPWIQRDSWKGLINGWICRSFLASSTCPSFDFKLHCARTKECRFYFCTQKKATVLILHYMAP